MTDNDEDADISLGHVPIIFQGKNSIFFKKSTI